LTGRSWFESGAAFFDKVKEKKTREIRIIDKKEERTRGIGLPARGGAGLR
jgi:hypothetical protein